MNLRLDNAGPNAPSTHKIVNKTKVTQDRSTDAPETDSREVTPQARPTAETVRASRTIAKNDLTTQQVRSRLHERVDGASAGAIDPLERPLHAWPRAARPGIEALRGPSAQVLPEEGFSTIPGRGLTFTGTEGDDNYTVRQSGFLGDLTITNESSGRTFSIDGKHIEGLNIDLRGGNDRLRFADGILNRMQIDLGDGNDSVRFDHGPWAEHTINGGHGDDVIDGSGGVRGLILDGGEGNDILQGGSADDIIRGGGGDDLIHGGSGNDQLYGQDGNDRIYGSYGDDLVHGGNGRDTLDGGTGMDSIYGDETDWSIEAGKYFSARRGMVDDGESDIIVRNGRDLGQLRAGANDVDVRYDRSDTEDWLERNPRFVIRGSDEFRDRTIADIGAILSTNQGEGLLGDLSRRLRDNGSAVTIEEEFGADGYGFYDELTNTISVANRTARYPEDGSNRAPLPILFHELVHAHQDASGQRDRGATRLANGAAYRNTEFQAMGLPYYGSDGQLRSANEYPFSDNKFRRELGIKERRSYGGAISPPVGPALPLPVPPDELP